MNVTPRTAQKPGFGTPTFAADALFAVFAPLASRLPALPVSMLLSAGANLVFGPEPPQALTPLFGKVVRICVTDAGLTFNLKATARGFAACCETTAPVVQISACLSDFLSLARREADPDTLFFDRRLSIEGDTELGLLLKNTFDALDLREVLSALPGPLRVLAALRASLPD